MAYDNPAYKRSVARKVRVNPILDRILARAAERAGKQHEAFLFLMVEWAMENGAFEALAKKNPESTAA